MSNSLFESDWWLDAVAPGRWRRLEVRTNDRVVATLPLVHKRRFGLDAFTTPLFTKFLGPWLAPPDPGTKYSSEIARQKRLLTELIDQIPPSAYFAQNLHPSLTNWQPFFWRGFSATVRYTYVLDGIADDDSAISGFRENVRRAIRKAEESLTVEATDDLGDFLRVQEQAFAGLGRSVPYPEHAVERLVRAVQERDAGRVILARDRQGRAHAGIIYVWDDRCTHYVLGGADPGLRSSGANSLLMWHAIRHAGELNGRFDFEGSMIESVEHFVRGFGGRQTPFFRVSRHNRLVQVARACQLLLGRRRAE